MAILFSTFYYTYSLWALESLFRRRNKNNFGLIPDHFFCSEAAGGRKSIFWEVVPGGLYIVVLFPGARIFWKGVLDLTIQSEAMKKLKNSTIQNYTIQWTKIFWIRIRNIFLWDLILLPTYTATSYYIKWVTTSWAYSIMTVIKDGN